MARPERIREIGNCTTRLERISYGSYFMGQNIFYLFILQYLMLFLTDYVFISPAVVGIIFLIAKIWDAVNDPLFGIIVDKVHLKKGKFKPWIKISTFLIPLATIAIFSMSDKWPAGVKIGYAFVTYILWDIMYTMCDVPIFALATTMTNNIQERTKIISIGRVAAMVAMLVLSIASMPIIMAIGWTKAIIILSILGFLLMLPVNRFAKERFAAPSEKSISIKEIFSGLTSNKYLLIFYAANIVSGLTNVGMGFGNYFAKYNLGGEQFIPLVMMLGVFPMLIFSAILPALTKKFDKFHIYSAGIIINIGLGIVSYFIGYGNLIVFSVFAVLRGLAWGGSMTMAFLFAADCVEYGEFKTGNRTEGIVFSVQTFATKLFAAVSSAMSGFLLSAIGYDATLPTQSSGTIN
ncbi:MAG: Na+/melibiose symporter and related transporter, partial [Neobacillus sp.]|nr:Na+/melibiose symporter and related transporter [Neobacillus sp.]